MKIHYLQHVPFEDIGMIGAWAKRKGHAVTGTPLFSGADLPSLDDIDMLIVMGGPMNVYEEKKYSWLRSEKKFIAQAIRAKKHVLGICLGAQLISDVLGGKVTRNRHKEIGWFPVTLTPAAGSEQCAKGLPKEFPAFHWHGDTFDLPKETVLLASSKACRHQAFIYRETVLGLQFHLEITTEGVQRLLTNCGEELIAGTYIQSEKAIKKGVKHIAEINVIMSSLLDGFVGKTQLLK